MSYHVGMTELMRQRERLLARCSAQRDEIATLTRQWEVPLAFADRAIAGINYLRQHPVVLGVLVGLVTLVQRRGWWGWAKRGFVLWRAYRTFRNSRFGLGSGSPVSTGLARWR